MDKLAGRKNVRSPVSAAWCACEPGYNLFQVASSYFLIPRFESIQSVTFDAIR